MLLILALQHCLGKAAVGWYMRRHGNCKCGYLNFALNRTMPTIFGMPQGRHKRLQHFYSFNCPVDDNRVQETQACRKTKREE